MHSDSEKSRKLITGKAEFFESNFVKISIGQKKIASLTICKFDINQRGERMFIAFVEDDKLVTVS